MPQRPVITLAFTILVIASGSLHSTYGQKRVQRSSNATVSRTSVAKEDKWWAAQRSIEASIQQLEAYLREAPNGIRAATARQQIAVLRNLSISASRPEWAKMDSLGLPEIPEWRVASVEVLAGKIRVLLEIRCDRQDGGDCHFLPLIALHWY